MNTWSHLELDASPRPATILGCFILSNIPSSLRAAMEYPSLSLIFLSCLRAMISPVCLSLAAWITPNTPSSTLLRYVNSSTDRTDRQRWYDGRKGDLAPVVSDKDFITIELEFCATYSDHSDGRNMAGSIATGSSLKYLSSLFQVTFLSTRSPKYILCRLVTAKLLNSIRERNWSQSREPQPCVRAQRADDVMNMAGSIATGCSLKYVCSNAAAAVILLEGS
uniref:SFRICE_008818 n=1 Tax=Spodoptera frugiperda TaxID=7108 RepID=A0A2H1WK79_SPOFR